MRLHRFIEEINLSQKNIKITNPELLNQVKNVLRFKKGDKLILSDGRLNEAEVQIIDFGKNYLEVEILKISKNENESQNDVILYCSILKKENFEIIVQKSTEIGVKKIYPLISQRTIKLNAKKERLEKIIKEAAEQSGRGTTPILNNPINFEEALNLSKNNGLNLFFDKSGAPIDFKKNNPAKIGIFIGPEGGWSAEELEAAKDFSQKNENFKIAKLSNLTLRAETAAIVASYFSVNY